MKVTIENVSKNYGKKQALNGVSFEMENGVYGLLGPNGSGKSTLIRIIVGVMEASGGEIFMNGQNRKFCDREYRSKIGYLPQSLDFYPNFSGLEYLHYVAVLKGLSGREAEQKIEALVKQVHLTQDIHRNAITYSGGMKRRLGIAGALLNDPEILILDELVDFQNSHIISNVLPVGDRMEVRVVSDEKPLRDAEPALPNLEDAYLYEFEYIGRTFR